MELEFLSCYLQISSYLIAKISPFFSTNVTVFSTNEVFEHFIMKKDPFNQIIKKWPPKGVLVDLLEKHLGMNVGL